MAQYLAADRPARALLLRSQKYPGPERLARLRFYSEARTTITAFHLGTYTRDEVDARIAKLRSEARDADRWSRATLSSNADVLERYMHHQGHRSLDLAPRLSADLVRSDVQVTTRPTVFALEHGERRIIFLELSEHSDRAAMRLLAQLTFEVFRPVLKNLPPSAIQVVDVRGGHVVELERPGASIGRDLATACKAITAEWPRIRPPRGWKDTRRASSRQVSIEWL